MGDVWTQWHDTDEAKPEDIENEKHCNIIIII
jgi:hypothetical protein